jgi:hypothetical protein
MINDNFYFYLQNRLIQTSQAGGQWYSDTFPLVFPGVCVCVFAIEIQTIGPISMNFGRVEDHDPGIVFVYV